MDLNKVISALGSSGVAGGLAGGVAGGALTSALLGKKGRKTAGTLLKVGGLAAVGGVAWKAYQHYQQQQQATQAPATPADAPPAQQVTHDAAWQAVPEQAFAIDAGASDGAQGVLLVRAMIAAAMADGHLDAGEQQRIVQRIGELGLDPDEQALVSRELLTPPTIDAIAAAVPDQATGIEVYTASVLAIDESRPEAQAYLDALSQRLALPALLVHAVHAGATTG